MADRMEESWGIVGYRYFTDAAHFNKVLNQLAEERGAPARVVSGGATGADSLARTWAMDQRIPFIEHRPSRFTTEMLKARNTLIVRDSTIIVAFVSQHSRGTLDMIHKAKLAKKLVIEINID